MTLLPRPARDQRTEDSEPGWRFEFTQAAAKAEKEHHSLELAREQVSAIIIIPRSSYTHIDTWHILRTPLQQSCERVCECRAHSVWVCGLFQRKSATLAEQLRHEKAAAIALVKEEAERRIQEEAEAAKVSNTTHTPFGAAAAISFFGVIYSKRRGRSGGTNKGKLTETTVCVGLSLGFLGRHEEERGQAKSRS